MIKRVLIVFGAMLLTFIGLNYQSPQEISISNSEKWRDWQTVQTVSNTDNSIRAVVEKNPHFGSKGFKPIIRVLLLQSDGARTVVWASGEASRPVLTWSSATELIISYEHNLTSGYRPSTKLDGVTYHISLDMNVDIPPHFIEVRDNIVWNQVKEFYNSENGLTTTVEFGEYFMDTAPVVRVLLSAVNYEPIEVWSTRVLRESSPVVRWIDARTLLISEENYESQFYYPAKKINGEVYTIKLERLK